MAKGVVWWGGSGVCVVDAQNGWVVRDNSGTVVSAGACGVPSNQVLIQVVLPPRLYVAGPGTFSGVYTLLTTAAPVWRRYDRFCTVCFLHHSPLHDEWVVTPTRTLPTALPVLHSVHGGSRLPQHATWSNPRVSVTTTLPKPPRPSTAPSRRPTPPTAPLPRRYTPPSPALTRLDSLAVGAPIRLARAIASAPPPLPPPPQPPPPRPPPPENFIQQQHDFVKRTKHKLLSVCRSEGRRRMAIAMQRVSREHLVHRALTTREEYAGYNTLLCEVKLYILGRAEEVAREALVVLHRREFKMSFEDAVVSATIQYEESQGRRVIAEESCHSRTALDTYDELVLLISEVQEREGVVAECGKWHQLCRRLWLCMEEAAGRFACVAEHLLAREGLVRSGFLLLVLVHDLQYAMYLLHFSSGCALPRIAIEHEAAVAQGALTLQGNHFAVFLGTRAEEVMTWLLLRESFARSTVSLLHAHAWLRFTATRDTASTEAMCAAGQRAILEDWEQAHALLLLLAQEGKARSALVGGSSLLPWVVSAEDDLRACVAVSEGVAWVQCNLGFLSAHEAIARSNISDYECSERSLAIAARALISQCVLVRVAAELREVSAASALGVHCLGVLCDASYTAMLWDLEDRVRGQVSHEAATATHALFGEHAVCLFKVLLADAAHLTQRLYLEYAHSEYATRLAYSRLLFSLSHERELLRSLASVTRRCMEAEWLRECYILEEQFARSFVAMQWGEVFLKINVCAHCFLGEHALVAAAYDGEAKCFKSALRVVCKGFGRYERKSLCLRRCLNNLGRSSLPSLDMFLKMTASSLCGGQDIEIDATLEDMLAASPWYPRVVELLGYTLSSQCLVYNYTTWDVHVFCAVHEFVRSGGATLPRGNMEHNNVVAQRVIEILSPCTAEERNQLLCYVVLTCLGAAPEGLSAEQYELLALSGVGEAALDETVCRTLQMQQADQLSLELVECRDDATGSTLAHMLAARGRVMPNVYEKIFNSAVLGLCDNRQYTLLHTAAAQLNIQMVRHLTEFLGLPPSPDGTPWHVALLNVKSANDVSHIGSEHLLLPFEDDATPLHMAVRKHRYEASGVLLSYLASADVADDAVVVPLNPLHLVAQDAAWDGHLLSNTFFTEAMAPLVLRMLNARDTDGCTPHHSAVFAGNVTTATRMVHLQQEAGVPLQEFPNVSQAMHALALHIDLCTGTTDLLTPLVTPRNVDGRDAKGSTALHNAVRVGNAAAARLLLARGSNVRAVNSMGRTPLHCLCRENSFGDGCQDLVVKLAEGTMLLVDVDGATPLRCAVEGAAKQTAMTLAKLVKEAGVHSQALGDVTLADLFASGRWSKGDMGGLCAVLRE